MNSTRILLFCLMIHTAAAATGRVQSRSMVITRTGIVATEQPLASQAGAEILARGGNAMDAAVAANAVMGVVSPMMCGIGGDMFCIVYDAKSGKTYGLNASGWSPRKLTLEFLKGQGHTVMPTNGIHSVTVPGTVDGWEKLLKRFGRLEMDEVLRPAIQHAEEGFPVTELVAEYWRGDAAKLRKTDSASKTFLPSGEPPKVGEVFKNPDLAWSYRQIARRGRKAFYDGEITARMLRFTEKSGGVFEPDDFREFESKWVDTITTTYRGWTVHEIPPNGQGIAALAMLNIMERFPLNEYGLNSARTLHVMIEAKKLAYADMLQHVGDPEGRAIPVQQMLSKEFAARRAELINPDQANCAVESTRSFEAGPDTTYLSVVDKDGNIVSFIQSNYYSFGTGLVPDGCGFALQNRGGLFTLNANHPNTLEGRKRPLHTIIPAIMEKGDVRIGFGIMGGWNQSQAHAQFVSKIADFGMNPQEALDSPRFTKLTFEGCDVKVEARLEPGVRADLEKLGHKLEVLGPYAQDVGGGQAVMRDERTGVNYGASDPRKDGAAIPERLKLR